MTDARIDPSPSSARLSAAALASAAQEAAERAAQQKVAEISSEAKFCPADETSPKKSLSPVQVAHYNREGYLRGLPVFDDVEARKNREAFEAIFALFQERGMNAYSINGFHTRVQFIYDLVTHPKILDYVEDLIGPDIVCWGAHFFCKMPGDPKEVSWHQDAPYWPLEPTRTVTVWLAIDDVDDENSALRVVPGTHRDGPLEVRESRPEEQNVLHLTLTDPADMEARAVTLSLKAGEISMHADLLVHGSRANRSNRRRCGVAIRYANTIVRANRPGWAENSVLCRGRDHDGHWGNFPRPTSNDPFVEVDALDDAPAPGEPTARQVLEAIAAAVVAHPREAAAIDGNFELVLEGDGGGRFLIQLQGTPRVIDLETPAEGEVRNVKRHTTIFAKAADYVGLVTGRLKGEELFFSGRLRMDGDIGMSLRLTELQALVAR